MVEIFDSVDDFRKKYPNPSWLAHWVWVEANKNYIAREIFWQNIKENELYSIAIIEILSQFFFIKYNGKIFLYHTIWNNSISKLQIRKEIHDIYLRTGCYKKTLDLLTL